MTAARRGACWRGARRGSAPRWRGCAARAPRAYDGGWIGADARARPPAARAAAGAASRRPPARGAPACVDRRRRHRRAWRRRARCARAGVDDFALLELEDAAGGNSRGHALGGIACPLGAHYLPVPGDDAREVQRAARGARAAPTRGRPLALRRAPPVPQPAGAPVLRRRLAGRPAAAARGAAGRERAHAGAVPRASRAAVDELAARGALRDPDRALALDAGARRARRA